MKIKKYSKKQYLNIIFKYTKDKDYIKQLNNFYKYEVKESFNELVNAEVIPVKEKYKI